MSAARHPLSWPMFFMFFSSSSQANVTLRLPPNRSLHSRARLPSDALRIAIKCPLPSISKRDANILSVRLYSPGFVFRKWRHQLLAGGGGTTLLMRWKWRYRLIRHETLVWKHSVLTPWSIQRGVIAHMTHRQDFWTLLLEWLMFVLMT
jgi:hypothetical protein